MNSEQWRSGKMAHRELSAAAAESYDQMYESANFATGAYMRYEIDVIRRWVPELGQQVHVAVDLGCGTGRDSAELCRHFDQVFGFDFSPEMIAVAQRKKMARVLGNVLFEVADVECGVPVPDGIVDFVNTAFGMASFLENPATLFKEVARILAPGGIALFSAYNSESLVRRLKLPWRPAMAASVDEHGSIRVDLGGARTFSIAARTYTKADLAGMFEDDLSVREITSFPPISALFPESVFTEPEARAIFSKLDKLMAAQPDAAPGPYLIVVCQKRGQTARPTSRGYARVLELLDRYGLADAIRGHASALTMDAVRKELPGVEPHNMVKSIVVAAGVQEHADGNGAACNLVVVGVPADRRADLTKVARLLGLPASKVRLASNAEVTQTGFRIGEVPPFGLPESVLVILDEGIANMETLWCGTGRSAESINLSVRELRLLSAPIIADICDATVEADRSSKDSPKLRDFSV